MVFAMDSEGRRELLAERIVVEEGRSDPRETVLQMLRERADIAEDEQLLVCDVETVVCNTLSPLQLQLRSTTGERRAGTVQTRLKEDFVRLASISKIRFCCGCSSPSSLSKASDPVWVGSQEKPCRE